MYVASLEVCGVRCYVPFTPHPPSQASLSGGLTEVPFLLRVMILLWGVESLFDCCSARASEDDRSGTTLS